MKVYKVKLLCFSLILILTSCASRYGYYSTLSSLLLSENYIKANEFIEQNKFKYYSEKDALLYWLDKGITLHYAGDYNESIKAFTKAEKIAEELYTRSISEEAASFLVSDSVKSYYGEDFERIFINVFQSLNYLFLQQYEGALVEARKVDHKLKTLQVDYAGKNVYKEDAFMRYLTGLLYESQKEFNDAFVSYRKAIGEYSANKKIYNFAIPEDLLYRMLKVSKILRLREEFEEITTKFSLNTQYKEFNIDLENGEIILFHYNGFAPYKVDNYIEVSFGEAWAYVGSIEVKTQDEAEVEKARQIARAIASNEQFIVAFPKFVPIDNKVKSATVEVYDETGEKIYAGKPFIVEDLDNIAIKNLEDRIAKIKVKSIARAAIKYALSREIAIKLSKNSDELSSWLIKKALQTTSVVLEQADKRSWRTLPKQIFIFTASLKPGKYFVKINFEDGQNRIVQKKEFNNIFITSGKKTFLSVRTY
ncbi:MAG: hypothetical protein NZ928_06585 [Endomicrobia bacterium]|nr:hypothetical protein [Endomicrobiia bacterium]MDW8055458.1 hypothetical protein [Elusimicrobiota bacterium]